MIKNASREIYLDEYTTIAQKNRWMLIYEENTSIDNNFDGKQPNRNSLFNHHIYLF